MPDGLRRGALMFGAIVLCGAFGVIQVASMSVYGDLARRPSIPALLPASIGVALGSPLSSPHAPAPLRRAYAQALVHVGDATAAEPIVRDLPPGRGTDELRGELAEIEGQPADALSSFAQAGDIERAQGLIDARVAAGDIALGAQFERRLVDNLTGDGRATVRARALWRLGQITQTQAVSDAGRRSELERASLDLYVAALAIAPNEETYLLAAGQQALTIGDKPLAAHYYARALEVVPASADAQAGLARART